MKLTYRNDQLTPSISHRGKTRNLNRLLLPVWLMATLGVFSTPAFPQDLASLDRAYHPGEPIHVVITFASPVQLSGGGVQFSLNKLDNQAQRLWTSNFTLSSLKPLQPNQYEASGTIPEYAASGVYRLTSAWSGVSDLSKSYGYPDTLHQDILITVINEKHDPLPAVTDVKLLK
jgi:hypothetical protein